LLVTGLFWGTWFSLSQSTEDFSAAEFIHIGKTIIKNVAFPMRIILPLCILSIFLVAWWYPFKKSGGFYYTTASFILILVTLLITLLVEVPIDNQINLWTTATVPSDWEGIRAKWQFFHSLRTITSTASFTCLAVTNVFYNPVTIKHSP
jgi:uncharacterized membrane protein